MVDSNPISGSTFSTRTSICCPLRMIPFTPVHIDVAPTPGITTSLLWVVPTAFTCCWLWMPPVDAKCRASLYSAETCRWLAAVYDPLNDRTVAILSLAKCNSNSMNQLWPASLAFGEWKKLSRFNLIMPTNVFPKTDLFEIVLIPTGPTKDIAIKKGCRCGREGQGRGATSWLENIRYCYLQGCRSARNGEGRGAGEQIFKTKINSDNVTIYTNLKLNGTIWMGSSKAQGDRYTYHCQIHSTGNDRVQSIVAMLVSSLNNAPTTGWQM